MTRLTAYEAIEYASSHALTLSKYADPVEDAREGLTPDEAREVAREDPTLIYLDCAPVRVERLHYESHDVGSPGHYARYRISCGASWVILAGPGPEGLGWIEDDSDDCGYRRVSEALGVTPTQADGYPWGLVQVAIQVARRADKGHPAPLKPPAESR